MRHQRSPGFRAAARIEEAPDVNLPCWLVETERFQVANLTEIGLLTPELRRRSPDEDGVICILYRFADEYVPDSPERDSMGSLAHHHLEPGELDRLEAGTFGWYRDVSLADLLATDDEETDHDQSA